MARRNDTKPTHLLCFYPFKLLCYLVLGNCDYSTLLIDRQRHRASTYLAIVIDLASVILRRHHRNSKPLATGWALNIIFIHVHNNPPDRANRQPFPSLSQNRNPTLQTPSILLISFAIPRLIKDDKSVRTLMLPNSSRNHCSASS